MSFVMNGLDPLPVKKIRHLPHQNIDHVPISTQNTFLTTPHNPTHMAQVRCSPPIQNIVLLYYTVYNCPLPSTTWLPSRLQTAPPIIFSCLTLYPHTTNTFLNKQRQAKQKLPTPLFSSQTFGSYGILFK